MDITTTQIIIGLLAVGIGGWAATRLYRAVRRMVRSRVKRMLVGALLGSSLPAAAGAMSVALTTSIGELAARVLPLGAL